MPENFHRRSRGHETLTNPMSESTNIQWADDTINFWRGCDKVSPGCKNCYIITTVPFRISGMKHGDPRVLSEMAFELARKLNQKPWICDDCGNAEPDGSDDCRKCGSESGPFAEHRHRRRIFTLSLGDMFDEEVPIDWFVRVLETFHSCRDVQFLVLTKRVENVLSRLFRARDKCVYGARPMVTEWLDGKPPGHIWLGASIENQEMADKRIPELLKIPAAIRFLSVEPLLEQVNLAIGNSQIDVVKRRLRGEPYERTAKLDWVIVGGESGTSARPCNVQWIRSVKDQCTAAGVPCFVKQLGALPFAYPPQPADPRKLFPDTVPGHFATMVGQKLIGAPDHTSFWPDLRHKKGGDPKEWPEDLRVREFPSHSVNPVHPVNPV